MAEGKNKIIIYRDWITTFESLTDEEAGRLIKHLFKYVNDINPEAPDRLTQLLFEPFKQTLKRDLKSYEAICLRNRINGALGGRPIKTDDNPDKPNGFLNNPEKPDSDSDSDNDSIVSLTKEELLKKRESEFVTEVSKYSTKYPLEMLKAFCRYWTEPNKSRTKMKWELEKTFEIGRRLVTWAGNDKTFNRQQQAPQTVNAPIKSSQNFR